MVKAQRRFADWSSLSGESQYEVVTTAATRARALQPILHAFVSIDDTVIGRSRDRPLARLPYAVKDMFAAPDRRPVCGLASTLDFGLRGRAEVLSQLDDAGACRVGFTAMSELAYEPSGVNSVCRYPCNPWNLDFIPGGSSSGSAIAVASGTAAVALGSDTGGSLRIPAHCTGVTGWKPTYGAVSVVGALPLAPFLDCIGLLARGAGDLAPAASALINDDQGHLRAPIEHVVVLSDVLDAAEVPIRHTCQQGIEAIQSCGVTVVSGVGLAAIEAIDVHALVVMQGEAARLHASRLDDPAINPVLRKRLAKGLAINDATLEASRAMRLQFATEFTDRVLGRADAAILPVMGIRTPPLTEAVPSSPTFNARRLYELSRYCRFVNMLGFPAVAVPVGFDDRGLPVAMQIVARPGRDLDLLALAAELQKRTDWHGRVPVGILDLVDEFEGVFA